MAATAMTWLPPLTAATPRARFRFLIDTQHQLAEGAAALAIAAGLKAGHRSGGQAIVIVSCGANISSTMLAEAIASATSS